MKKFALIFVFCFSFLFCCACKKQSVVLHKINTFESYVQEMQTQINETEIAQKIEAVEGEEGHTPTIGERTEFVICFISNNYEEYNFNRFIEFGVAKLVEGATAADYETIVRNMEILEIAIAEGNNLSQPHLEVATGPVKAIFDIERPLFRTWYNIMISKN